MFDLYTELEKIIVRCEYGATIWVKDDFIEVRECRGKDEFYDCRIEVYFDNIEELAILYKLADEYGFDLHLELCRIATFSYTEVTTVGLDRDTVQEMLKTNVNYLMDENPDCCIDYLDLRCYETLPNKHFDYDDICRLMQDYQREHNVYSIRVD